MNLNVEEYFYIINKLDIIALFDINGKIRVVYFYGAWGNSIRIIEYNLGGTEKNNPRHSTKKSILL